jgi:hypothetical protein
MGYLPEGTGSREHRSESVRSCASKVSRREELVTGSMIVALRELRYLIVLEQ